MGLGRVKETSLFKVTIQTGRQDEVRTKLRWKESAVVLITKPMLYLNLKTTLRETMGVIAVVVVNWNVSQPLQNIIMTTPCQSPLSFITLTKAGFALERYQDP
jgi:hypothetical protein